MSKIPFLVLLFSALQLFGQFTDDFSDGTFTENPPWVGDQDKFIVDNEMLRLHDQDEAGMAYLATQSQMVHNTQWDFWMRLAFTPSDNNHARIYLVSNQSDLSGPLDGYFIQAGMTGGDNKRLYFYRQDGEEETLLMEGSMNLATTTNNILRVRVTRDMTGNWTISADPEGESMFVPQGEVWDNTHALSLWFGIRCTYTKSNSTRFYFDDFRVGEIIPEDPPVVNHVEAINKNALDVVFSRVVKPATAENINHYFVEDGVGHPMVASLNPERPNIVRLLFFSDFDENHVYPIRISGVDSYDGQLMEVFEGSFIHYVSNRFDVVFNELMVNSRPVVSLPPHDWLELYNTTDIPVDLDGWILQHQNTRRTIPKATIQPKDYLVLTTEEALPYLLPYGHVVAVPGLSANALTMGGAQLLLWDDDENLVSFVHYSDRWYNDPSKADGGWSLEKIDPYNFCEGAGNWTVSEDSRGGTPSAVNSVFDENPNLSTPDLLRAGFLDENRIMLHFSEPMDEASLSSVLHYQLETDIGHPDSVMPRMPDFSKAALYFHNHLADDVIYTLKVSEHMVDCAGNPIGRREVPVAVPQLAKRSDIVINEVLFNPPAGGARYVEIFNASGKVFDMQDYILASKDTILNMYETVRYLSEESYLLFPEDYLVLTNDVPAVKNTFMTPDPEAFLEMDGMPRMTNAGGVTVLATRGQRAIDRLVFSEDMHLPLLANTKGVAIERVCPLSPVQELSNWHSASAAAGYGTPGYQNTQYLNHSISMDTNVTLEPKVFAPDGSGHHDLLNIHYAMNEPGYVANIRIYDRNGRLVRNLVQGKLLATSGVITWDGVTDKIQKAPVGMYVVHVEAFNHQGEVLSHTLTAILAAQL